MATKNEQYEKFDQTMQELLKVPHSEIKAKLDAEKTTKKRRTKSEGKDDTGKEKNQC